MSDNDSSTDTPQAHETALLELCDGPGCAEALRELDLFLDAELSDAARQTIRHHLDHCPDCLSAFDFHAELKQVVSKKCQENEMPPGLLSRIEMCFNTDFDGDGVIG